MISTATVSVIISRPRSRKLRCTWRKREERKPKNKKIKKLRRPTLPSKEKRRERRKQRRSAFRKSYPSPMPPMTSHSEQVSPLALLGRLLSVCNLINVSESVFKIKNKNDIEICGYCEIFFYFQIFV